MTVLFFNHGYSSIADAISMIREASDLDSLTIVASHRDPQAPSLAVADVAEIEPLRDMSDAEYLNWCLALCDRYAVDLFFAQTRRAVLADYHGHFAAIGTRLCVPADRATLALIEDKARFYDAALAAQCPMAWTREVSDLAAFDAAVAELEMRGLNPCIKPPEGVFGTGFWKLESGKSLMATVLNPTNYRIGTEVVRLALRDADTPTRLLVMETLEGDEWSIDCVVRDGEWVAGASRRKLGREQLLATDGPEFEIARRAISAMKLSGLVNVQCKAACADHSDLRLLEINTRMSGGCAWTKHTGLNLPWVMVASELGCLKPEDLIASQSEVRIATRVESYVSDMNKRRVKKGESVCVI